MVSYRYHSVLSENPAGLKLFYAFQCLLPACLMDVGYSHSPEWGCSLSSPSLSEDVHSGFKVSAKVKSQSLWTI